MKKRYTNLEPKVFLGLLGVSLAELESAPGHTPPPLTKFLNEEHYHRYHLLSTESSLMTFLGQKMYSSQGHVQLMF